MKGTIIFTPDQLADVVAAALQSNGYHADTLALYLDGKLVAYDQAVVGFEAPPLRVRNQPEKEGAMAAIESRLQALMGSIGAGPPPPPPQPPEVPAA